MSTHTIGLTMGRCLLQITYDCLGQEIAFREARYAMTDEPAPIEMQNMAAQWLVGDGYWYAVECAETDLNAMRHAQ